MFEKLIARFAKLIHSPIGLTGNAARTKRRPTGAALRNAADPTQAARIEAAAVKRARRAVKLTDWALRSERNQTASTSMIYR